MSSASRASFADDVQPAADPAAAAAVTLFRQAQNGDRAAFGRIVELYQDRLYNATLRMLGDRDEARELTQEAFTRALVGLDGFRAESQPYTWLFRIAVNLSISRLRKVQSHRVFSLDVPLHARGDDGRAGVDRQSGPHEVLEQRERHDVVLAALGRVDADYRAVLVMRDIEGFDYQQMAGVLNLPLGTLKSRLFRARLALRDELQAYLKD